MRPGSTPARCLRPRSAIPVVTCLLAILVESRYPSGQELAALITLTVGVMLAVWQGTVTGKPYAIIFCLVGTVCNGAMMTFSGKVLRWVRRPLSPHSRARLGWSASSSSGPWWASAGAWLGRFTRPRSREKAPLLGRPMLAPEAVHVVTPVSSSKQASWRHS